MFVKGYHALHIKCRRSEGGLVDNVDKKYTGPAMACQVQKSHADFLPNSTAIIGCILEFGVRQLLLEIRE
jgi:hypothetical protein